MGDRKKDDAAINKSNKRRDDAAASKGGKDADKDTRKAMQALKKLLGG